MKLKFNAIQILVSELMPDEMGVIYLMGLQKAMPENVTPTVFTNIIAFLCKKLDWVENDQECIEIDVECTEPLPKPAIVVTEECIEKTQESGKNLPSDNSSHSTLQKAVESDQNLSLDSMISKSHEHEAMNEEFGEKRTKSTTNLSTVDPTFSDVIENDLSENSNKETQISRCAEEVVISEPADVPVPVTNNPKSASEHNMEVATISPELDMSCFEENQHPHQGPGQSSNETNSDKDPEAPLKSHMSDYESMDSIKFSCNECGKLFSNESDLAAHKFIHEIGEVKGQIPSSYKENDVNSLQGSSLTDERPYSCSICGQRFATKAGFSRHEIIHTDKALSCSQCDKKFSLPALLKGHEDSHTRGTIKYGNAKHRIIRLPRNLGDKLYSCTHCELKFSSKNSLCRHQKIHTDKAISCSQCDKKFVQKLYLERHMLSHLKGTVRPLNKEDHEQREKRRELALSSGEFTCIHCNKRFGGSGDLKRHQIRRHASGTVSKGDQNSRERRRELVLQSGKFSCPQCDKKFEGSRDLKKHEKRHAGETIEETSTDEGTGDRGEGGSLKPYRCPHCEHRFAVKSSLRRHKVIHTGKAFGCSSCNKIFSNSTDFKRHQQRRHGIGTTESDSQVQIPIDPMEREKRKLQRRLREEKARESGEFSCSHCDKKFGSSSRLRAHEKLHTGERPFMCSMCGQSFIDAARLKRHEIGHINNRNKSS